MMDLSAYRDIFIEELNDQLERMDQSLLALELSPSVELVQTLFRANFIPLRAQPPRWIFVN